MALFSDIDWIIILGVAAFLLFGQGNGALLRTFGRYYGRAMRLKQELLSEFTQAAELPTNPPGRPLSIRQFVLGYDATGQPSGIPAAVSVAPGWGPRTTPESPSYLPAPYAPALAGGTWSVARPSPSSSENL